MGRFARSLKYHSIRLELINQRVCSIENFLVAQTRLEMTMTKSERLSMLVESVRQRASVRMHYTLRQTYRLICSIKQVAEEHRSPVTGLYLRKLSLLFRALNQMALSHF